MPFGHIPESGLRESTRTIKGSSASTRCFDDSKALRSCSSDNKNPLGGHDQFRVCYSVSWCGDVGDIET